MYTIQVCDMYSSYIDRRYDMLEIGGTNNMYYVNMILNNKWTHCNIAPLHQLGTCHNNK